MADPAQLDLIVDRNVDFVEAWPFVGEDFTGSTFKMQVRAVRDTTATPLLEHTSSSPGTGAFTLAVATATIAAHIAAGRLKTGIYNFINPNTGAPYAGSDVITLSSVRLAIIPFYLQSFPLPAERGDDPEFVYDIVRTPGTGPAELILSGKFIVRAGVTIP